MDYGCITPFVDTTCTNIEDSMVGNAIFSKDRVKLESSIRPPVVSVYPCFLISLFVNVWRIGNFKLESEKFQRYDHCAAVCNSNGKLIENNLFDDVVTSGAMDEECLRSNSMNHDLFATN